MPRRVRATDGGPVPPRVQRRPPGARPPRAVRARLPRPLRRAAGARRGEAGRRRPRRRLHLPAHPPRRRAPARPPRAPVRRSSARTPELVELVAELVDTRRPLDATPATLELEALQLDLHRLDREITAARTGGEGAIGSPRRRAPEGARRDPPSPAVEPKVRPTHELVFVSWTRTGSRPNWPPAARSSRSRGRWGSTRRRSATRSKKHGLQSAHAAKHAARGGVSRETLRRTRRARHVGAPDRRGARAELRGRPVLAGEVRAQDRAPPLLAARRREDARRCSASARRTAGRSTSVGRPWLLPLSRVHDRAGRRVPAPGQGAAWSRRRAAAACCAATTPTPAHCSSTTSIRRQKRFALSHGGLTGPLEQVREEARKCVLLCGNCHAEVEAGLVEVALPADTPG